MSPSQKYEIWLQLVRQEVTMAEEAAQHQVDRSTNRGNPLKRAQILVPPALNLLGVVK